MSGVEDIGATITFPIWLCLRYINLLFWYEQDEMPVFYSFIFVLLINIEKNEALVSIFMFCFIFKNKWHMDSPV